MVRMMKTNCSLLVLLCREDCERQWSGRAGEDMCAVPRNFIFYFLLLLFLCLISVLLVACVVGCMNCVYNVQHDECENKVSNDYVTYD
jgi:hypothetical protein